MVEKKGKEKKGPGRNISLARLPDADLVKLHTELVVRAEQVGSRAGELPGGGQAFYTNALDRLATVMRQRGLRVPDASEFFPQPDSQTETEEELFPDSDLTVLTT